MTAIAMNNVGSSPAKQTIPEVAADSEDHSTTSAAGDSPENNREDDVNMDDASSGDGEHKDGRNSGSGAETTEKSQQRGHNSATNSSDSTGSFIKGAGNRDDSSGGGASAEGTENGNGKKGGEHGSAANGNSTGGLDGENRQQSRAPSNGASGTSGKTSENKSGAAGAAPPPPPLLKGTLSYNQELRKHILRGMWNYENSDEFAPQRFELYRTLREEENLLELPKDGEFHGSFSLAYHHTNSKGKVKERSKVITESGVNIKFTRKEGDSGKEYIVEGQGTNTFGVFHIYGKATSSHLEGDPTFNVELRKKYVTSSVPASNSGSKKSKSKSKKRKHDHTSQHGDGSRLSQVADDDSGPLPPPSKSHPTNVVCLRGKLSRLSSDSIGIAEMVHRITGLWSSGLDLLEADPQNERRLCNKFEYEHRCTVPTDVFPLSGRYTGWFYISNEDGGNSRVTEKDVHLKFRKNNAGFYNVEGRGSNGYGKYQITGTLSKDNILTIFRHFQLRKGKKSGSVASTGSSTETSKTGAVNAQDSSHSSSAHVPGSFNGTSGRSAQPQEPPVTPALTLDMVEVPGETDSDTPLAPVPSPAHGSYSAVSRGVLRVNEDGAHTCSGKWAATREHYNNSHTSNFHFGLEAHRALEAAEEMKNAGDSGKSEAVEGMDSPSATIFPVDSVHYKGSFKMRRGTTKYQSIIDKQIVLKFRKNTSGQGSFNVYGRGVNSIGTFTLVGTLILGGRGSGHVELYRMYPVEPVPRPGQPVSDALGSANFHPYGGKALPSPGKPSLLVSQGNPGQLQKFSTSSLPVTTSDAAPSSTHSGDGYVSSLQAAHLPRRESSRQTRPPSRLEDNDPQAQLMRIMEKCNSILQYLRERDLQNGAFFSEPVDPVAHGIPSYHQVITNPMDLGTIGKQLDANEVKEPEDFARLVRLVFENAMTFNEDSNHVVHQAARNLLILFNQKFRDVERMMENMKSARKPTKAELKEAAKEAKKKEKEAKRKAKEEEREQRKRTKLDHDDDSGGNRAKLDDLQSLFHANEKTLAEINDATPADTVSGGTVSRNEFNLLMEVMKQMQQQMGLMHSLLSMVVASGGPTQEKNKAQTSEKSLSVTQSKPNISEKKKASKKSVENSVSKATKVAEKPPAAVPSPPPIVEEKPLSLKEQEELTETINRISSDKLPGVIQIIRESASLDGDEDEIDLEIDQLDTATQRKLQRFVMKNVKPRKPKKKPQKKNQESKASTANTPAPAPAPAPEERSPLLSTVDSKDQNPVEKEENNKSKGTSDNKGKPTSNPFIGFSNKDDSGSDSDSDSDSDTSTDKSKRGSGKNKVEDNNSSSDGKNASAVGNDQSEFGITSMQDDDDDDEGMAMNWNMSQPASSAVNSDSESDEDDNAAWKTAQKEAAATKQREAERKAREEKKRTDAELAIQQRQKDAAARGEQIRAQRMEEEANEQRLREQQEREADKAREAARKAARDQKDVVQTVDLDAQRDIMKEYEQSIDYGGSASPSSDFGF